MKTKLYKPTLVLAAMAAASVSVAQRWDCGWCGGSAGCAPTSSVYLSFDPYSRVLTLNGSGKMIDYSIQSPPPWHSYKDSSITELSITSGVTRIGENAFNGFKRFTLNIEDTAPALELHCITSAMTYEYMGFKGADTLYMGRNIKFINANGETIDISEAASLFDTIQSVTLGAAVTAIPARIFSGAVRLTSIVIPDSVKSIGRSAFSGCGLAAVNISKHVTHIGSNAFGDCPSLAAINVDAANPRYVSEDGVLYNKDKTCLLQYPAGKVSAFAVPASVEDIAAYAFYSENGINITLQNGGVPVMLLPSQVNYSYTYNGFKGVDTFYMGRNIRFVGDNEMDVEVNASLFNSHLRQAELGGAVTSIPDRWFSDCTLLTGITIQQGISSIGNMAFAGSGIRSVNIPGSVTSIGASAFRGCRSLQTVTFAGDSDAVIGSFAFYECSALTGINITKNIKEIGESAFARCRHLRSLEFEIGTTISSIGKSVFEECDSLKNLVIPASVRSIGERAFKDCKALGSGSNDQFIDITGVTSIGSRAFENCGKIENIILGGSLTHIGERAFRGCAMPFVALPVGITSIGEGAFSACPRLVGIGIDSLNMHYTTYERILYNKNKTTLLQYPAGAASPNFIIPSSVTRIADYAFSQCPNLTHLASVNSNAPPISAGDSAFEGTMLTRIQVHVCYAADYKMAAVWSRFADKITPEGSQNNICHYWEYGDSCSNCGTPNGLYPVYATLRISEGVLTIKGSGYMKNAGTANEVAWHASKTYITAVTTGRDIKNIGSYAFSHCLQLRTVSISESVESVSASAFDASPSLNAITVSPANRILSSTPEGILMSINQGITTLVKCPAAKQTAVIPLEVLVIASNAFADCGNLQEVIVERDPPLPVAATTFNYDVITQRRTRLYVPNSDAEARYKAADVWKWFDVQIKVPATGVLLNLDSARLPLSDTVLLLTTAIRPDNATNPKVSWRSSNTAVASVDDSGKVRTRAEGIALIIVTTQDGGYTDTCTVTVFRINEDTLPNSIGAQPQERLQAYPTIASRSVIVQTQSRRYPIPIRIYALSGMLAGEYQAEGEVAVIDIARLPQGIYIIRADGRSAKIVKR